MSEIICTKCGVRYSARHLARAMSINDINNVVKGDVFSMSSLKGIRVELYRGDKVVYSSYNESDNAGRVVRNQTVRTEPKPNPVAQQPAVTKEAVKPTPQPTTVQQPVNQQPNQRPVYQGRFEPIRDELIADVTEWLDSMYKKHGKGAAIDLAKRLNLYYIEPEVRKGALLTQRNKFDNKSTTSNNRVESTSQQQHKETDNNATNQEQARQTGNLFIVQPKTAKEIEAEEIAKRDNKDEFLGIVGQPMVNKMKLESSVSNMKSKILTTFNYNIDQLTTDQELEQFSKVVKDLISDELNKLAEISEYVGLVVGIEKKLDTKNMVCYSLKIMSPTNDVLMELDLYPKEEEGNIGERQIAEGIEVSITIDDELKAYMNNKIAEYLIVKSNAQQTEEEYKSYMIGSLIGDLQKDKGYEFGTANTIAYNYLTQCNWGMPPTTEDASTATVTVDVEYDIANEL